MNPRSWSQVSGFNTSGTSIAISSPRQPSIRQAITAIVRTEGLRALWKGNGATIIHRYGHICRSSYMHAPACCHEPFYVAQATDMLPFWSTPYVLTHRHVSWHSPRRPVLGRIVALGSGGYREPAMAFGFRGLLLMQAAVLGNQLLGVRAADGVVECCAAASTGLAQHGCCTPAHCWRCCWHGRLRCGACTLRITLKMI